MAVWKKKIKISRKMFTYAYISQKHHILLKTIHLMSVTSWVFCLMGPKKQGFCSKINCIQMKLLYFVNWYSARASKSTKIDFKSQKVKNLQDLGKDFIRTNMHTTVHTSELKWEIEKIFTPNFIAVSMVVWLCLRHLRYF